MLNTKAASVLGLVHPLPELLQSELNGGHDRSLKSRLKQGWHHLPDVLQQTQCQLSYSACFRVACLLPDEKFWNLGMERCVKFLSTQVRKRGCFINTVLLSIFYRQPNMLICFTGTYTYTHPCGLKFSINTKLFTVFCVCIYA